MRRPARFIPALAIVLGFCLPSSAAAIPLLQLGIAGGTYDTVEQETVSGSRVFTLYAYLTPAAGTSASQLQTYLNTTFYIAASLTPRVTSPANLGSFSFNGTTVNATSNMVYGTPPYEPLDPGTQDNDSGDLASHGTYQTYFKEFSFKFKSGSSSATKNCAVNVKCTNAFDTQTTVGTTPPQLSAGNMYFMAFQVNTTNLNSNYQVHFDLYSTQAGSGNDIDIKDFAPFSHDARSYEVPEPSTVALLGAGVLGLAIRYRRKARR